ncbi:MAG: acyl carrier protein [Candidatus Paceibacterota bacterium]|jgi:acyl carrier protein
MEKLNQILAKVLEIDPNSITDLTSPENTPSWDSFNGLLLITELEKGFEVKFTIDEVVAVKNVGDIKKALKRQGVKLD